MDLKKSSITADILNFLADCKVHTLQEIANEIEVSKITVYRHIQSLSYRYPIQTFCGGANKGGVYLYKGYVYQGKTMTTDELQLISKALELLQKFGGNDVDPALLSSLQQRFALPNSKENVL